MHAIYRKLYVQLRVIGCGVLFLQSWRDLFQFGDGDLISRCARLHSENMDWRIFFVNGACRETPMPLSLAPFLLKGMQCPAVLLWNLGSHTLHLLTETEATCWHWHLTLEGFPCIAWNGVLRPDHSGPRFVCMAPDTLKASLQVKIPQVLLYLMMVSAMFVGIFTVV